MALHNQDHQQPLETLSNLFDSVLHIANHGGPDVNAPVDDAERTPLHVASMVDSKPLVQKLLQNPSIDLNKRDNQGATSLLHAVLNHHTEIVALLLQHGAAWLPDNTGLSPWIAACVRGFEDIVDLFMAAPGFDVNHADKGNVTALFTACSKGHAHLVPRILRHNPSMSIAAFLFRITPLHSAVALGHAPIVRMLLDHPHSAEVLETPCIGGSTALHMACEIEDADIVRLLLERGASPWARLRNGRTILDIALETDDPGIAELVRKAALEPLRMRLLRTSREVTGETFSGSTDDRINAVVAYVTRDMLSEHFAELGQYMLRPWELQR